MEGDPFFVIPTICGGRFEFDWRGSFQGGAIGFVGYDLISLYEPIGHIPKDTIGTPDMHFFIYESYLVFDHKKEILSIHEDNNYSGRSSSEMERALAGVLAELKNPAPDEFAPHDLQSLSFKSHLEKKNSKIWLGQQNN